MGMSGVDWLAYVIVAGFNLMGIEWVSRFRNRAGPLVYVVMIALALMIWWKAGSGIRSGIGAIFQGGGDSQRSTLPPS